MSPPASQAATTPAVKTPQNTEKPAPSTISAAERETIERGLAKLKADDEAAGKKLLKAFDEQIEKVRSAPKLSVDARADLYSLGATLYTILTGRPPFTGPIAELLPRILNERPVPPTRYHLSIPAGVEGVILKLLAKRPEDRYDSATALLSEMRRVRQHCS